MSLRDQNELPTSRSCLAYTHEHAIFRDSARRFFETECAQQHQVWENAGIVPRSIWKRAGELGFLCPRVGPEYSGLGVDFLFSVVLIEEQIRAGVIAPVLSLQNDIVAPYLVHYGTEEQKRRFLPALVSGDCIGAIALTEPSGGSDPQAVRTTARPEGDGYRIKGQKTFVTGGIAADLIIVAATTAHEAQAQGVTLFLLETDKAEGFRRGSNHKKLGQHSSDTAELFFDDMWVPRSAILGGTEGRGFAQLTDQSPEERLVTAIASSAMIERALAITVQYVKDRQAFGRRVIDFQNTRFKLAEAKTEATVLRVFLERCISDFMSGQLDATSSAALKYWSTEQQCAIIDDCLQLHGGYGYILDFPIARMWLDGRLTRISAGANEIMKDIIGSALQPETASDE